MHLVICDIVPYPVKVAGQQEWWFPGCPEVPAIAGAHEESNTDVGVCVVALRLNTGRRGQRSAPDKRVCGESA